MRGVRIVAGYANQEIVYIILSDDRFISYGLAGSNFELLVEEHDEVLQQWFDSLEPREANLQKLIKEHPRWLRPQ